MESQAASSTARLEREQDARHMQSVLQTADQEAQQRLQQAAAQLEAGRAERREAAARTSALEHEAEAAEEQAQSARRRLPGLEADKKAAAAARVSSPDLNTRHSCMPSIRARGSISCWRLPKLLSLTCAVSALLMSHTLNKRSMFL